MKIQFEWIIALLIVSLLILGASGCQKTQEQQKIIIKDFSFNPPELTVSAGTNITWVNNDQVTHDITIDNGLFDHDLNPSESFSFEFNEPGEYTYHCDIHPSMKGKVIVK